MADTATSSIPKTTWDRMGKPAKIEALYHAHEQMEINFIRLADATKKIAEGVAILTAPPEAQNTAKPSPVTSKKVEGQHTYCSTCTCESCTATRASLVEAATDPVPAEAAEADAGGDQIAEQEAAGNETGPETVGSTVSLEEEDEDIFGMDEDDEDNTE